PFFRMATPVSGSFRCAPPVRGCRAVAVVGRCRARRPEGNSPKATPRGRVLLAAGVRVRPARGPHGDSVRPPHRASGTVRVTGREVLARLVGRTRGPGKGRSGRGGESRPEALPGLRLTPNVPFAPGVPLAP